MATVTAGMRRVSGTRTILESKLARAQRIFATLEGEALARSLGTGRAVPSWRWKAARSPFSGGPTG